MKRYLVAFALFFAFGSVLWAIEDNATLSLVWNPENTQYIRFGFSTEPPEGMGWTPSETGGDKEVAMGNPIRTGEKIQVSNTTDLYAFCQAYGNKRFDVSISGTDFTDGTSSVPFTISWGNGSVVSGSSPQPVFSYLPSVGTYSQQREITIKADLPASGSSSEYTGTVSLIFEVIE